MLGQSEGFAYQPAQPISHDGISSGFHRHRQAEARLTELIGFDTQREEAIVDATPGCVDCVELRLAAQAQRGAESEASGSGLHGGPLFNAAYGTIFLRPLERRRERTF
jgi:hypothetical protein